MKSNDFVDSFTTEKLAESIANAQNILTEFADDPEFLPKINIAFGKDFNTVKVDELRQQWAEHKFELPEIEIRPQAEINGALGGFSQDTNKIYLSQELFIQNNFNFSEINSVLLEEVGHFVDAQINQFDTPGDEGAIFSALVNGKSLNEQQLQQLRSEDDRATVTLDNQVIQIEQATVSDSGGYEGSQQTLTLGSKGGGKATVTYQMYTIPDQIELRYEGKDLLNTGFVSGGKTIEVDIPKGNSNQLDVILSTNNVGTAWDYTVTTDDCPDPFPLNIEVVGGQFKHNDGDEECEAEGTILIGRKDGISQMLRVENAKAEYDNKRLKITGGTVYSLIGAGEILTKPLFQGDFEIPFSTGTSSSFKETGALADEFKVGGLDVDFNGLTINQNGLALGAKFKLIEDLGLPDYTFNASDALLISQDNVDFGSSVKFSLPNFKDFQLFNLVPIKEFSNFAIEYIAPEDKIKIQGKLSLNPFAKQPKAEVVADLSGDNFLQIKGGKADIKGGLSVKNVELVDGWKLNEATLTIDTINKDVGGKVKVTFPFGTTVPPKNIGIDLGLGFKLPIPPLELNLISAEVDGLNVPIGETGAFLQAVKGKVDNLAPSDLDPIEYTGGVKLTAGPKVTADLTGIGGGRFDASLLDLDLSVTINKERLKGTGKVKIINDQVASGDNSVELNWDKKFLETKGNFSIIDGLIKTNSGFKANTNFDITMSGGASVNLPKFVPFLGGAQIGSGNFLLDFTNNGNYSDDFGAGWTTVSIQKLGLDINFVTGFKAFFDGRVETIGSKNLPKTHSFTIAPNTEWLLMGADWDNDANNVQVEVKEPDGTILNESQFAANNIAIVDDLNNSNTRVVLVKNPGAGIWDIKVADDTGLGQVKYSAFRDSVLPSLQITSPTVDVSGGNVTIGYNAFDADSNAKIKLFYDTDNTGFDGIAIANDLVEVDGAGNYVWNTQGTATGDYFIYGMIMDENNAPVFSNYSLGKVKVGEQADLAVTKTASTDPVGVGSNFTYSIKVVNNGSVTSNGVQLAESLPQGATFVSASLTASQISGNDLSFNLGNLASGASQTIDVTVTAPTTTGIITSNSYVTSQTFDPNASNDGADLATTVNVIQPPRPDLVVTRSGGTGPFSVGDTYTYALNVTNTGSGKATNVVLQENLPFEVISATANLPGITQNPVDLIRFQLDAGQHITIDIDAATGSNFDSILRIFDDSGKQVAVNDDGGPPDESFTRESYLDFTASSSGTYYAGISGYSNFSYNPLTGDGSTNYSTGNYTVEMKVGNSGLTNKVALSEPNNTIAQAVNSGLSSANPGTFIGSGSIRGANNNVVIGSNGVTANLGDLNSGESATVNLSVKSVVAGDIITTTNATSRETDRNFIDNSLITSTTVNSTIPTSADLELTQTVSNTNPNVGDRINFTLNLTNKGPGIASGIKVTDFVPSGLSFVSASPEQGTYDSNTGVWDVGNVRDNLTRTLSITANVVSGGRIVNTAQVTAVNEADPDSTPDNNNPNEDDQATVTLLVPSNDINGTPGRDTLNGTSANERITGFEGADILTGGGGNDEFIYTSFRDAGDIITDFVAGADKIVLTQLFQSLNLSLNYGSANQQGYLSFATQGDNTTILIDPDGSAGRARPTPFITVQGVSQNTLASAGNFVF